jgi:NAD binding domain of 6-phosphogluconate dehydrogenase
MGSNMARNFAHHGYTVALHNQSIGKTDALLAEHGSEGNFVRSETIPEFLCRAGETAAGAHHGQGRQLHRRRHQRPRRRDGRR